MTTPVIIVDPRTGEVARVTRFGQLSVAPLDFSTPVQRDLLVVNTASNFVAPEPGQSIIITDVIISTDKAVGPDGATIEIYTADSATSTTVVEEILKLVLEKQQSLALTGLNFMAKSGFWINGKTDDNNAFVTLAFYRVPIME